VLTIQLIQTRAMFTLNDIHYLRLCDSLLCWGIVEASGDAAAESADEI
jgi:hypothetical protein